MGYQKDWAEQHNIEEMITEKEMEKATENISPEYVVNFLTYAERKKKQSASISKGYNIFTKGQSLTSISFSFWYLSIAHYLLLFSYHY